MMSGIETEAKAETAWRRLDTLWLSRQYLEYPMGIPAAGMDVLWRCECKRYSTVIDAELEIYGTSDPRIQMYWIPVKHRTSCGARLKDGRFVNLKATKQWACNSQKEALESLLARQKRYIGILEARLRYTRQEHELAKYIQDGKID
jgi:hypothetical protein